MCNQREISRITFHTEKYWFVLKAVATYRFCRWWNLVRLTIDTQKNNNKNVKWDCQFSEGVDLAHKAGCLDYKKHKGQTTTNTVQHLNRYFEHSSKCTISNKNARSISWHKFISNCNSWFATQRPQFTFKHIQFGARYGYCRLSSAGMSDSPMEQLCMASWQHISLSSIQLLEREICPALIFANSQHNRYHVFRLCYQIGLMFQLDMARLGVQFWWNDLNHTIDANGTHHFFFFLVSVDRINRKNRKQLTRSNQQNNIYVIYHLIRGTPALK